MKIAPRYELFIGGKFVAPQVAANISPRSIPPRRSRSRKSRSADAADVDAAVGAARRAFKSWSALPGRERGKYLYRIARILQEKARELAVLETMDGGKPIKESRDFDLPQCRRAFLLLRRLGGQTRLRLSRPQGRARRRVRADHPLEFPAADGRVETRARAGLRQYRASSSPPRPPASPRCTSRRFCRRPELPPGVVNIVTGAGETGARARRASGRGQARLHRQHRSGQAHRASPSPARTKKLTLELGGKAAQLVFEDAPIDQAVEGIIARHLLQSRPRLLRRVAAARAGEHLPAGAPQAARPHRHAARRRSAGQEHRHRRDQQQAAARKNPRPRRQPASAKAASSSSPAARCRPKVTGSRPASSPASPPATAWRRRKSSAPCSAS